ncbi:MAG: secreted trypsin-like serine protease [Alphaproteobacteria bacterium]|jgi:secreted trypsin-like serine protease
MNLVRGIFFGVAMAAALVGAATVSAQNYRPAGGKIVGGSPATSKGWPGQAALRNSAKTKDVAHYFCGGTAISKHWVLTAAHCMHEYLDGVETAIVDKGTTLKARLQVVLGADDLTRVAKGNVFDVTEIQIHPKYRPHIEDALDLSDPKDRDIALGEISLYVGQDIALLRLNRPYTGKTSQLSLTRNSDPANAGARVSVTGFGKTIKDPDVWGMQRFSHRTRKQAALVAGSSTLLQTAVETVAAPVCREAHKLSNWKTKKVLIGDAQICAGLELGGKDSCNGDSGGPLTMLGSDGKPYQIGVVSWGKLACASQKSYGIYTRVSSHADWIQKHTGPLRGVPASAVNADTERLQDQDIQLALSQLKGLLGKAQGGLRIGIEGGNRVALGNKVRFQAESDIAGRLAIIDINASGEVLLIFPNTVFEGQFRSNIKVGERINVPTRGHGNAFRAVEPTGKGRLIGLVVPKKFDIARHLVGSTARTKGFAAVHEPTSYFMRFIRQIEGFLIGSRTSGGKPLSDWAYDVVEYEIVR